MNNNDIKRRIAQVITTNAISVNRNEFLATHTPFKNLKYTISGREVSNPKIISEDDIFVEYIVKQQDRHNFMVVQGDNGSGKSHFIRWVKEKYENEIDMEKEALIFISRGQNTLKGTLEQIINSDVFDEKFREEKLKKFMQANESLSESFLKTNIILQFAGAIKDDKELDRRDKDAIYEYLVDSSVQNELLKEEGPINRFYSKLANENVSNANIDIEAKFIDEDFKISDIRIKKEIATNASTRARRYMDKLNDRVKGDEYRANLAKILNSKIEFVIQNCTNLRASDLKSVFEELRIELKKKGKNLTLLIEDITSFTGIDKALVEVLVTEDAGTEYNEQFCRIFSIIGVTNAYYKDNFPDNLKDRVTGRILIEGSLFLHTEEELSELAGRYINAINLEEKVIDKWVKNGAYTSEIPTSNSNLYNWCTYKLAEDKNVSIFPFTSQALYNMYNGLDQKSARGLLNRIIKVVLDIYYADPSEFIDKIINDIGEFIKIPNWKESSHEAMLRREQPSEFEKLSLIMRLWGNGTIYKTKHNGSVYIGGISEEFFEFFKLPIIVGIESKNNTIIDEPLDKDIITNSNSIPLKIKNSSSRTISTNTQSSKESIKVNDTATVQSISKEQKDFNIFIDQINEWMNGNGKFRDVKIKEDLIKFIKEFIDWESKDISRELVNVNVNLNKIAIEDQNYTIIKGSFILKKSYELKDALIAVAAYRYLGNKKWNFYNSDVHLLNLTNYILGIKEDIVEYIKYPPDNIIKNNDWNMDKWSIYADIYINLINGNLEINDKYDVEKIYEKIMTKRYDINYNMNSYEEDIRAKFISKLMEDEKVSKNHDVILNRYNCILGDINKYSSDVYFIDAYKVLKEIDEIIDSNIEISNIELPKFKNKDINSDNLLYLSNTLLNYLCDTLDKIIQSEDNESKKRIKYIEDILGPNITNSSIAELFEQILNYLNLLDNSREMYSNDIFRLVKSGELSREKFILAKNNLEECIKQKNKIDKIIKYSNNPIKNIQVYIDLFKATNKLVDDLIEKYEKKGNDNNIVEDIASMKLDIENKLINIKQKLEF